MFANVTGSPAAGNTGGGSGSEPSAASAETRLPGGPALVRRSQCGIGMCWGGDNYLAKPVPIATLCSMIERWLARSGTAEANAEGKADGTRPGFADMR